MTFCLLRGFYWKSGSNVGNLRCREPTVPLRPLPFVKRVEKGILKYFIIYRKTTEGRGRREKYEKRLQEKIRTSIAR